MVIRRILAGLLALTAVVAAGCTSGEAPSEPLPDGRTLIADAAAAPPTSGARTSRSRWTGASPA
ncbi:hypothetical protein ACFSVJ_11405 [Prauserella oleivorans]